MSEDDEMTPPPEGAKVIDLNLYAEQREQARQQPEQSFSDAVESFRDAIAAQGLGRPEVVADGKLHRFDLPDEPRGKRTGWYVFYPDNIPSGAFGSWKHDISQTWCSRQNFELSSQEIEAVRERLRQAREARDAEQKRLAEECAKIAAEKWATAQVEDGSHPYLVKKQVGAFGVKTLGKELLVPMWNASGVIVSLQRIYPDGNRRFLLGTIKEGSFGWIDGNQSTIYIAEGYATAASIHMATGHAVAIAFDAGNLESTARTVKEVFPQTKILVAADNDRWTQKQDGSPWNVGVEKAQAAAHAIGSKVLTPDFRDLSSQPTDFNDLASLEGLDEVRRQVSGAEGPRLSEWETTTAFNGQPQEREWLIRGVFPRGQVSMIAAAGGVGKSFLLLSLARDIADTHNLIRPSHFGGPIEQEGRAVYVSAEDDRIEIHGRLHSLGGPVSGLYAVPLPSAGGTGHFFRMGPDRGPTTTPAWESFVAQLRRISGLKAIIIDPLQPLCSLDLNLPESAQFVCSVLSGLAASLDASVILSHHFRKTDVTNPEDARQAIRGTSALVDGVRSVYALWPAPEDGKDGARAICRKAGEDFAPGCVVNGCVVKANGVSLSGSQTYFRRGNGVLCDMTDKVRVTKADIAEVKGALIEAVAAAAIDGRPYTRTSGNGLYERRHELPEVCQRISKHEMARLVDAMFSEKRIVISAAPKSTAMKWLDVPDGPFAIGAGQFQPGFQEHKK